MVTVAVLAGTVGVGAGILGFNRTAASALGLAVISITMRFLP